MELIHNICVLSNAVFILIYAISTDKQLRKLTKQIEKLNGNNNLEK